MLTFPQVVYRYSKQEPNLILPMSENLYNFALCMTLPCKRRLETVQHEIFQIYYCCHGMRLGHRCDTCSIR